jgi:hypothetical protein
MGLEGSTLTYVSLRANIPIGTLSRFLRRKAGLSPLTADSLEDALNGYYHWERPRADFPGRITLLRNFFDDRAISLRARGIQTPGFDEYRP